MANQVPTSPEDSKSSEEIEGLDASRVRQRGCSIG